MRKIVNLTVLAIALGVAGCAGFRGNPPMPGDTVDTVRTKLGQPTAVYPAASGQELEYAHGPMGQTTWMAHIGSDGRLTSYEQVLTGEKFATIRIDHATRDDVLRTIGRPAERSYLPLRDFEVWSYRYKESGIWNSIMHVHFDRAGVVRMMLNAQDPMFEEKDFMH